jgi:hypothetical protein
VTEESQPEEESKEGMSTMDKIAAMKERMKAKRA